MNTPFAHATTQTIPSARSLLPASLIALAIGAWMPTPSPAASISDTPSVLDYDAAFNEVNNIEIKPNVVSGHTVLDIRDFAGLNGCNPFPTGSVISIRCPADALVFFPMQLDNQDDTLVVNQSLATLTGYQLSVRAGLGDDDLTGGSEEDQFFGDAGADLLNGEGGIDALYGEAGDDALLGGDGTDQLYGGGGNDTMYGEAGADTLDGGSYDDFLDGGTGADTLRGGSGGDRIHAVDGTRDIIDCGLGRDIVRADPIDQIDNNCESVTLITL